MVSLKNVTTEAVFTIEKRCDRCRNVLYFPDAAITDIETDSSGNIIRSSLSCPICSNLIVLYSIDDDETHDPPVLKPVEDEEEGSSFKA